MPGPEVVLTACPRDCHDSCGIAVLKQDGVITRVRGDRNSPVNDTPEQHEGEVP